MNKLVFATNNAHKVQEVQSKLAHKNLHILTLKEVNINTEIPEDFETLEENALQKAQFIFERTKLPVFADDTGLFIEALNGEPGVYSARYAGEGCSFADNVQKVLANLGGTKNRKAYFKTVIAYLNQEGKSQVFEGVIHGEITVQESGAEGFGYDPIFKPNNYSETFAEMPLTLKNQISHRALAVEKFVDYLSH